MNKKVFWGYLQKFCTKHVHSRIPISPSLSPIHTHTHPNTLSFWISFKPFFVKTCYFLYFCFSFFFICSIYFSTFAEAVVKKDKVVKFNPSVWWKKSCYQFLRLKWSWIWCKFRVLLKLVLVKVQINCFLFLSERDERWIEPNCFTSLNYSSQPTHTWNNRCTTLKGEKERERKKSFKKQREIERERERERF